MFAFLPGGCETGDEAPSGYVPDISCHQDEVARGSCGLRVTQGALRTIHGAGRERCRYQ